MQKFIDLKDKKNFVKLYTADDEIGYDRSDNPG